MQAKPCTQQCIKQTKKKEILEESTNRFLLALFITGLSNKKYKQMKYDIHNNWLRLQCNWLPNTLERVMEMVKGYCRPPAPNTPKVNNDDVAFLQTGTPKATPTATGGGAKKTGGSDGSQDNNNKEMKENRLKNGPFPLRKRQSLVQQVPRSLTCPTARGESKAPNSKKEKKKYNGRFLIKINNRATKDYQFYKDFGDLFFVEGVNKSLCDPRPQNAKSSFPLS